MKTPFAIAAALLTGASLSACEKQIEAPTDRGVCWQMVQPPNVPPKFNQLATGTPDLEHCAGELEKMRVSFQSLGVPQGDITGAYQGQFLFLNRYGVFTSERLTGYHYPFMVRTGDGRLAVPGAMPPQSGGDSQ